LPVKAFMDIGGAGHSSDVMAIWICQFVQMIDTFAESGKN